MHICPQCKFASIPAWRAFVIPAVVGNRCVCSHCGARLVQRRGLTDVLPVLPVGVTGMVAIAFDAHPFGFMLWSLGVATLAGLAIWPLTIRYQLDDEPVGFTPHPSSPPR